MTPGLVVSVLIPIAIFLAFCGLLLYEEAHRRPAA